MTLNLMKQIDPKKMTGYSNQEELLAEILKQYTDIYPIKDAYLYGYSSIGFLTEGVMGISDGEITHIRNERDDVTSLSVFQSFIENREAKFFDGIEFMKLLTSNRIVSSTIKSSIVVPLCAGSIVIGFIISYSFDEDVEFDEEMIWSLTLFGRRIGNILGNLGDCNKAANLSRRELEVMQHISWGDSSSEIADIWGISESTVNQYVKSALKKLNSKNRPQAVAELLRKGIIL